MMNRIAIRLSLAALLATAPAVALASDAALTKLLECMKMKAATPEQKKCLEAVSALRRAAPKAAATTARPKPMDPKAQAAAAAKAPPVPAEVKQAATVLAANGSSISGVGGVRPMDISGLDLETAMMLVQTRRAELLETQLVAQINELQKRNDNIAKLNTLLSDLAKLRPSGTDPLKWANLGADTAQGKVMYKRLEDAGVTIPKTGDDRVDEPGTGIYDARQRTIDAWVQELKGEIESANSSQQMDMLKVQSLSNKRNEAFDIMTNFIKKMADQRSSILGNMR